MKTIRDIMSSNVLALEPQTSVRDAMELLAAKHFTGAPVVCGGELVGVISAADLLAFAVELPGISMQQSESSDEVLVEYPESDEMDEGDSAASYFVDYWQDSRADVSVRFAATERPDWSRLEEHTVSEVMTTAPLCTLPSSAAIKAAAECMGRLSIRRVLVVDDGALVGIVTATDITRASLQ
jgi:CBS domain-containing protein